MTLSRRALLRLSGASALGAMVPERVRGEAQKAASGPLPEPIARLESMTQGTEPISLDEHKARIGRAQKLMAEVGLDGIVVGPSTALTYFTGAKWGISERFLGVVLPAKGDPVWVTPAFERRRAEEQIQIGGDIRSWEEDESPYALVAGGLRDRKIQKLGIEERLPYVFSDGIARAMPSVSFASATPVTAGCRMIKDAHEIALMRRACEITVRAHRAVFESLKEGMTQEGVAHLSEAAHERLGIEGGSLVLFGKDAAFPHGTTKPSPLKPGEFVLLDGGGLVHGYSSDISRTAVFGAKPTDRQRTVWQTVRKAQEAAFQALKPGAPCQSVDAAARGVLEAAGFGGGYKSLTHRVGHGIGMDGHEWTYLVKGNDTPVRPGMCFSNEPGIYIPGELGCRLEDLMYVTETGSDHMAKWSGTPEEPAVV
jgi:Xaa-Pro dipeptidase